MLIDPAFLFGALVALIGVCVIITNHRHVFLVHEGSVGVLFHKGKLSTMLPAGRHVRWGRFLQLQPVEARRMLMQIAGQDVLTAGNVSIKLSIVLTTQIVDAARALQSADNFFTHVYNAAQSALRTVVAGVTMDELLNQRTSIGGQILELVAPVADAVGVKVHGVEVRDVMLPGELRRVFSEVLKAKQEAQVTLERARSESAALRNLANAARLVENVPALATLRFFQSLESSGSQTVLMNDLSSLLPALSRQISKPTETEGSEG